MANKVDSILSSQWSDYIDYVLYMYYTHTKYNIFVCMYVCVYSPVLLSKLARSQGRDYLQKCQPESSWCNMMAIKMLLTAN